MDYLSTKERIIISSIELFSQKGYTETSVKEIAEAAGIRQSSIYNHFKSKKEILEYILHMYMNSIEKKIPQKDAVQDMILEKDIRTILETMFFIHGPQEINIYTKIVKIILHEQYRNPQVGDFVKGYMIRHVEEYIAYVLDELIRCKRIKPVNSIIVSKIMNSVNLAGIMEFAHRSLEEYNEGGVKKRSDILDYLINVIGEEDIAECC